MPSPDGLPKPRAPAPELLEPCKALRSDDGSVGGALRADTANRDAHIDCQRRQGGLVRYVRNLIAGGWLSEPGEDPR